MSDVTVPVVDDYPLGSPEFIEDPYPVWARMRDGAPVWFWEPADAFVVVSFDAVRHALASEDLSPSRTFHRGYEPPPSGSLLERLERSGLFHLRPAEHTRVRRLVSKAFTPASVSQLAPTVASRAGELVSDLVVSRRGDVAELFSTFPLEVIAAYLGLSGSDVEFFSQRAGPVFALAAPLSSPAQHAAAVSAMEELEVFLRRCFDDRRSSPRDDLLSRLVAASFDEDRLSSDEMFALVVALLLAGVETTSNLITLGTLALLSHRDQFELLCADPGLVPEAVEEMLRWSYIGTGVARFAVRDTVLSGVAVPAGSLLFCSIGAALTDPEAFEDPRRFDVRRRPEVPPLAFGIGPHYCIGAALARLEAAAVFTELVSTAPSLQLDGSPVFTDHLLLRGLKSLPVAVP